MQVSTSNDVADLRNVDWQLQTMVQDGQQQADLAGTVATLRIAKDDRVTGHACTFWGGTGVLEPGFIRVSDIGTTLIGCTGIKAQIDDVTQALLTAGASWVIEDGALRLTEGATTLTYRPKASPWNNPSATTLVEGSFGEAIYRLSWQHNSTNDYIGVEWESRDEPGVGLGGSGIGRSVTEDITHLDPSGATVAGRGFVYVSAPLSVDRVVWSGPAGEVDLQRHSLPAAQTWHLFAGFVNGPTRGGQAVGCSAGAEALRSRTLPY